MPGDTILADAIKGYPNRLAEAINLSDLAAHPAEALAALVEMMKRQEASIVHLEENQMIQAKYYPKAKTMKAIHA
jgi:hypothetical protein